MSAKTFRRLTDYAGHQIECTCQNCQHTGIVSTLAVTLWFRAHRWSDALDTAGHKFVCSKCQRRWPRFKPASMDAPLSHPTWGDYDAQKRLVKRLRG